MPTKYDRQSTDSANSSPEYKSVKRDNDLSSRSLGSMQSIARSGNKPFAGKTHDGRN